MEGYIGRQSEGQDTEQRICPRGKVLHALIGRRAPENSTISKLSGLCVSVGSLAAETAEEPEPTKPPAGYFNGDRDFTATCDTGYAITGLAGVVGQFVKPQFAVICRRIVSPLPPSAGLAAWQIIAAGVLLLVSWGFIRHRRIARQAKAGLRRQIKIVSVDFTRRHSGDVTLRCD
jgi:hypothetical protein